MRFKYILFFIAWMLILPLSAGAATVSLSPSANSVEVGQNFSVRVWVNTQNKNINNSESILFFPNDLVEVLSVSKSSSVFSMWVEEPSFSNSLGKISWNGGLPTPGYNGLNGTVLNINFKAKNVGTAIINFGDSYIRANDGLGTDVLASKSGTSITIRPLAPKEEPKQEVKPTPEIKEEPKTEPVVVEVPAVQKVAPEISLSGNEINKGAWVTVFGKSENGVTRMRINLETEQGKMLESVVDVTPEGFFSLSTNKLKDIGSVSVWATEVLPDGSFGLVSNKVYLQIYDKNLVRLDVNKYLIIYLAITWLILIFLLVLGWYKYFHLRHQINEKRRKIE